MGVATTGWAQPAITIQLPWGLKEALSPQSMIKPGETPVLLTPRWIAGLKFPQCQSQTQTLNFLKNSVPSHDGVTWIYLPLDTTRKLDKKFELESLHIWGNRKDTSVILKRREIISVSTTISTSFQWEEQEEIPRRVWQLWFLWVLETDYCSGYWT